MSTSSQLISEFIQALRLEVEALKRSRGGSVVRLLNGRLLREAGGVWVYHFQVENIFSVIDDTPAEIEIDGRRYSCQVISVKGLEVYIALEQNLGPQIAEAIIRTNLWYLLELLCKKFEEARPATDRLFKTSERLFAGMSRVVADAGPPRYELLPDPPNESQKRAIEASFSRSLAVIWGPPGTGKTRTIAKAVQAHLNAGRRVLLVSHANTAVDEALEKIAHQLKETPFYREGRLIRLGTPCKETLEENYPLVMLKNIAALQGRHLLEEKKALEQERVKVEAVINICKTIIAKQAEVEGLLIKKERLNESLKEENERRHELEQAIGTLAAAMEQNKRRLAVAREAGPLKRFFLGLNPERIEQEMAGQAAAMASRRREEEELEQGCREVEKEIKAIEEEVASLTGQLSTLFLEHNIKLEKIEDEKKRHERRLDRINSRIADIDKALGELQKKAFDGAALVATTLTKTFSDRDFPEKPFDVLIVDESSMAPLPYLYWAAGKVKTFITVVGDFLQLPPICVSEEEQAQRWLGRSIFNVLNIDTVQDAVEDERVALLDTQYRMHPAIADISNGLFYENMLKNAPGTGELLLRDSLSGEHQLILVNTEGANPWGSQLVYGGRFNLYHAFVAAVLARDLLQLYSGSEEVERIGVISPYSAQARLIGKMAEDMGIRERVRVNTVHSFQGGEEAIVILDTVEGYGHKRWSMLDDKRKDGHEARLLANVAVTRARCKLFVVGNRRYVRDCYRRDSVICRLIDIFSEQGYVLPSESIDDSFLADNFEKWAVALAEPAAFMAEMDGAIYSEKSFWPAFTADLLSAQESVMIMSPFVALQRIGKLQNCFKVLLNRGVEIRIFTRPPADQGDSLEQQAAQAIELLQEEGIKVILLGKMHQKIAVIDRRLTWEGSLNILSHNTTQEHMRRFVGPKTAEQIIRNYGLDAEPATRGREALCPECAKKGLEVSLVVKQGRYGSFLSCPNYPRCNYSRNISKKRKWS